MLSTESAGEYSSAAKGETLAGERERVLVGRGVGEVGHARTRTHAPSPTLFPHHLSIHPDTIRTVEGYADAIVLRHFAAGSARAAAAAASIPLINAGDGPGQHPTQALLDVYTIRSELGRLNGVRVALVGDLANGRTARSLAYLLSSFPGVSFVFGGALRGSHGGRYQGVFEREGDQVGGGELEEERRREREGRKQALGANQHSLSLPQADDLKAVASSVDVLYQTRIQKERFQVSVGRKTKGVSVCACVFRCPSHPLNTHRTGPKTMKPPAASSSWTPPSWRPCLHRPIVMHPLPRVDEITADVDADPRAAYFRQAKNGLYVRMALLKLALLGE